MTEHYRDVIISVRTGHHAQVESWLLGHGFAVSHREQSVDGGLTFYAVNDLSADGRAQLELIGGEIVREWKRGEPQPDIVE